MREKLKEIVDRLELIEQGTQAVFHGVEISNPAWYQGYISALVDEGIITEGEFEVLLKRMTKE